MSSLADGMYTLPQPVLAPLPKAAIFLTVSVSDSATPEALRTFLSGVQDTVKDVNFRDPSFSTTCVVGIGAEIWPDLIGIPAPKQLKPFPVIKGEKHTAIATPGDLFFHIQAPRQDLAFELERILLEQLGDMVSVDDETVGFRYFDARDLLGFVDGTANPVGPDKEHWALIGDRDPQWAGGSYVLVQKYLHTLKEWNGQHTETQEEIIGRTKLDNIELPDAVGNAQKSHKTLNTIDSPEGERDILRDNMPFGSPATGEFGTYFIGYAGDLDVTEEMLRRMFIGDPPGKYDRILDFSTPVTGGLFFVPPADFLEAIGD